MVASMIHNPDAFMWLLRVRRIKMDEHSYYYLLRSSSWAILFARHLGLPKNSLQALALSLLLRDVGQLQLPKKTIIKTAKLAKKPSKLIMRGWMVVIVLQS